MKVNHKYPKRFITTVLTLIKEDLIGFQEEMPEVITLPNHIYIWRATTLFIRKINRLCSFRPGTSNLGKELKIYISSTKSESKNKSLRASKGTNSSSKWSRTCRKSITNKSSTTKNCFQKFKTNKKISVSWTIECPTYNLQSTIFLKNHQNWKLRTINWKKTSKLRARSSKIKKRKPIDWNKNCTKWEINWNNLKDQKWDRRKRTRSCLNW